MKFQSWILPPLFQEDFSKGQSIPLTSTSRENFGGFAAPQKCFECLDKTCLFKRDLGGPIFVLRSLFVSFQGGSNGLGCPFFTSNPSHFSVKHTQSNAHFPPRLVSTAIRFRETWKKQTGAGYPTQIKDSFDDMRHYGKFERDVMYDT